MLSTPLQNAGHFSPESRIGCSGDNAVSSTALTAARHAAVTCVLRVDHITCPAVADAGAASGTSCPMARRLPSSPASSCGCLHPASVSSSTWHAARRPCTSGDSPHCGTTVCWPQQWPSEGCHAMRSSACTRSAGLFRVCRQLSVRQRTSGVPSSSKAPRPLRTRLRQAHSCTELVTV